MSRLPSCTAADVERVLKKARLILVHQKGSHRYWADRISGEVLITVPNHPGDLPRPLVKKIIKDVGLTERRFRELL